MSALKILFLLVKWYWPKMKKCVTPFLCFQRSSHSEHSTQLISVLNATAQYKSGIHGAAHWQSAKPRDWSVSFGYELNFILLYFSCTIDCLLLTILTVPATNFLEPKVFDRVAAYSATVDLSEAIPMHWPLNSSPRAKIWWTTSPESEMQIISNGADPKGISTT